MTVPVPPRPEPGTVIGGTEYNRSWWIGLILFILLLLVIVGVILVVDRPEPAELCADFGYPDIVLGEDGVYCHKVVNGSDVLTLLSELQERNEFR